MNAKIIAVMAILAVAFAGFAIAAEQTDAVDPDFAFTFDQEEYYVMASGTTTATITISIPAALESNLSVTATSATTAAVSIETSPTEIIAGQLSATFTATYVAQGSSVITFSATDTESRTYGGSVTVYAGIQSIDPAKAYVIAGTTMQSVTISVPNASNEIITAVSSATESKIGDLTVGAIATESCTLTFTPTNEFIGSEVVTLTCGDLTASIIVYSANAAAMGYVKNSNVQAMVFSDAVIYMDTSSIDTSQKPMVYFEIDFNATGNPDGTPDLVVGPMAAQKRMTIEIPGYILFDGVGKTTITIKNWSDKSVIATFSEMAFNENISFTLDPNMPQAGYPAYKSDGTTVFVSEYAASGTTFLTRTTTVDTYIMSPSFTFIGWASAADATEASFPNLVIGEGTNSETFSPVAPTISEYFFATYGNTDTVDEDEVYIIYAIWDDKLTIEVLYWYGGTAVDSLNGNVYSAAATSASDTVIAKVIQVPSYARVGDSFLLRIQQETAGNYTYNVTLYTKYEWNATSGAVVSDVATLETARMITNGVWLVDDISENIKIVVTATASAGPVTGYHFAIDEVSSGPANYALLSWDAIDYKPVGDIKIGGTYFHQIEGIGNVYGDLSLLESVNELTYALTVDNVAQTAPTANTVDLEGTYNSHDESYNFDYKVTVGTGYTIYAAQGLWDNDADEDYDVFTPWSLIAQSSS